MPANSSCMKSQASSAVRTLAVLLLVAACSCLPALAQINEGSFIGRVTDQSGAIVVGATVHALNAGTNVSMDASTNDSGYFEFPLLTVGAYVLTVEKPGF